MEWLEFMSVDRRARELTSFDMEQSRRRSGSGRTSGSGKNGSGSGAKRTSASSAARNSAAGAKRTPSGTKAGASASKRSSASANGKRSSSAANRGARTSQRRGSRVEENPLARRNSHVAYAPAEAPRRTPAQARYEAFDRYDAPPRRQGQRPPQRTGRDRVPPRKKKRRRSPVNGTTFFLLLLIVGMIGIGVWRQRAYADFTAMKAVVAQQTFYAGTTVEGVDVSQMTLQEALDHWNAQIEPQYREIAAVLNDGTRLTAAQMGYFSDYETVLAGAWNAGRQGSLVERYNRIALHMESPSSYEVTRCLYDDAVVRSFATQLAQQVDAEPKDAALLSFDTGNQSFQFEPEQPGRTLNQEKLVASIEGALAAGGGSIVLEIDAVQPAVTLENVSAQYGMISSAVTNASSSSSNRLANIKLAISYINGTCLTPGETFSFNDTVGERTTARGFKTATAYSGGTVTEEVGGGICQVSTTLFNAAVKANLTIKERSSHSLTVSYVDVGKDAAVDWGNKDLKFTNSTDENVYICCYLSDDKRVYFGIFGKLLPDGMSITLESQKTGDIDYETEYQVDFTMASGSSKVIQKGKKGTSAVTYKVYWDASGNEIQREQLCKSNYKATKEIIAYGP